ncbi:transcription repressor NadR [Salirhabdus salicampi]|uniref:transcription repressor NadR n=1 Tax=Salirhabdus salicampi TaxID=476102 RepID=UPI0020C28847|nr:transcription repressor NadR [Salirhabdus salicampi]MCP8615968.1 transcription repressor NadR [Salirhabdus salicampi]
MTRDQKKMLGENRRNQIHQWLKSSETPLTGSELAQKANVSRQVIVQDISLLKAKNIPIIATAQGYVLQKDSVKIERVIACQHPPEKTRDELYLIVDKGVTVKSVTVEHAIYGHLTGSLMLSNRLDVDHFVERVEKTKASLLSELTDGVHLHTIEADREEQLDAVCESLQQAGYLLHQGE